MVGTVDLQSTCESTSDDVSGLWTYLQQIVGQPFLFFRESYGDELTLHLGTPREPASPKLRRRLRGSYVLTFRCSIWSLLSGTQPELTVADPLFRPEAIPARQLELAELEQVPPIEPGTLIELARPFRSDASGGFGLLLVFADQSRLMIRPSPRALSDSDGADLPEIADWELFTPYGRYLRVGPGPKWAYVPSGRDETTV
jgi:hypothetical protein